MAKTTTPLAALGRVRRALALLAQGAVAAFVALGAPAAGDGQGNDEIDDADYAAWMREPIPVHGSGPAELVTRGGRSGIALLELPTISTTEFTPESVIGALRDADSGLMTRPADLVEAMFGDDRVQGVLSTRTLGLLGLPLQFFGDPDMVSELRGTEALGGAPGVPGDFARMFPTNELAKLLMWGILLGVGLAERVPDDDRALGARSTPALRIWHPRWLRYQWTTDTWHLTTRDGEIELDLTSGRWILYLPYGAHRPWAYGAWRACAMPWILKAFAVRDRARHSEVLGSAARIGTAPQNATEPQRRSWLSAIRRMARDHVAVLPAGFEIKMLEASATADGRIYSTQIEWADRAIAITLAGQAVTTEGTSGFSNGNIHNSIRLDLIQFTGESLSDCLYGQGLVHWARDNYGSDTAPFVRWDCSPPEDKQALADAFTKLGGAITALDSALKATGSNKTVEGEALCNKFGVPLRERTSADVPKEDGPEASSFARRATVPPSTVKPRSIITFSRAVDASLVTLSLSVPGDDPPARFRIFKAGRNDSRKGPVVFDDEAARLVMAAYEAHGVDIMLDLEHLSLDDKAPNFDPDARGWCKLAVRNGELWAESVRWAPDGETRLREKRQRYISPAFSVDPKSKRVTELVNIAITAMPATDHLTPLVAARARAVTNTNKGQDTMFNPKLLAALGLPEDADDEAVTAAMGEAMKDPAKMAAMLSAAFDADDATDAQKRKDGEDEEPSEGDKAAKRKDGEDEDEAGKDKAAKRSRRSSVSDELAAELVALRAEVHGSRVRELLSANRTKVTPALERWALKAFASDPEGLADWLKAQPVIATPRHEEKKREGGGGGGVTLTEEDRIMCRKLGRDPKEFLKHKRALNGVAEEG